MANKKFYGMKNDYMFKAVLQCSNEVLKNLVAALLEIDESEIRSCVITNPIELGKSVDAKDCVLDVKLELNDSEIIDLELQVRDEHNWPERSLLYWSRAYDNLKEGEDYDKLKKTYHIGILDFTLFEKNQDFFSEYKILDVKTRYNYSDMLNIRILDLTQIEKAEKAENKNEKLIRWAKIFKAKTLKEIEVLAGKEEVFKKMVSQLKKLSEDEKIRQQLEAREDNERRLRGEYKRGNKDGLEKGLQKGLEKGLQQGLQKGLQEGEERGKAITLITQIKSKYHKGKTIEQMADELETNEDEIKLYYDAIKENSTLTSEEIYDLCSGRNK